MKQALIFFARDMGIGGLERSLLTLLNALARQGADITLVLEHRRGELLGLLDRRICVKEYSLSALSFVPLRRAVNLLRRLIWWLFNSRRYALSCAYCTYSVIGSRLALIASPNSVLYVHSSYFDPHRSADESALIESLRPRHFRRIVFVSNESREGFIARYPSLAGRCLVIGNPVDCESIRAQSLLPSSLPPLSRPVFTFVGRLEEQSKRLSRLIAAFALLRQTLPRASLIIAGGGGDEALCRRLIEENGLSRNVVITGSLVNPYPCMVHSDCIVLSSDYEGFPVVYYEALTLKKRLVTTVRASDDAVDIGSYALIARRDEHSLAEAMLASLSAPLPEADVEEFNRLHLRAFMSMIPSRQELSE